MGLAASAAYLLTAEGVARSGLIPLLVLPTVVGALLAAAYRVAGSLGQEYDGP